MISLSLTPWLLAAGIAAGGLVVTFAILIVLSARTASGHLTTAANIAAASSATVRAARPSAQRTSGIPAAPDRPVSSDDTQSAASASDEANTRHTLEQLDEYYAANISQGNAIFWASLLSMTLGFAIVFAGVVGAGKDTTTTVVAGIAGVLSQFIAATFLVALRSTQQQSTTFAQMLTELRLRDLRAAADARATDLGLRLLSEIDGAGALANQTRASLAMGLIVKEIPPAAPLIPTVTVTAGGGDGDGDETGRHAARSESRPRVPTISADDRKAPAPPVP